MDSIIVVFVMTIFAVSLACCFTMAVLFSKKIRALSRRIHRLERALKAVRE